MKGLPQQGEGWLEQFERLLILRGSFVKQMGPLFEVVYEFEIVEPDEPVIVEQS